MTKEDAIELSKPFFKAYTKAEEFFLTAEGTVFKNIAFALNHIEKAVNKQIIRVTREEACLTNSLSDGDEQLTHPVNEDEQDVKDDDQASLGGKPKAKVKKQKTKE